MSEKKKKKKSPKRYIYVVEYKTSLYHSSIEVFADEGAPELAIINKAIKFLRIRRKRKDVFKVVDSYPLIPSKEDKK
jgi:hypothetical protein